VTDCADVCTGQGTATPPPDCNGQWLTAMQCAAPVPVDQWTCLPPEGLPPDASAFALPSNDVCHTELCAWACCVGQATADTIGLWTVCTCP
jgi:hypothetical protein